MAGALDASVCCLVALSSRSNRRVSLLRKRALSSKVQIDVSKRFSTLFSPLASFYCTISSRIAVMPVASILNDWQKLQRDCDNRLDADGTALVYHVGPSLGRNRFSRFSAGETPASTPCG